MNRLYLFQLLMVFVIACSNSQAQNDSILVDSIIVVLDTPFVADPPYGDGELDYFPGKGAFGIELGYRINESTGKPKFDYGINWIFTNMRKIGSPDNPQKNRIKKRGMYQLGAYITAGGISGRFSNLNAKSIDTGLIFNWIFGLDNNGLGLATRINTDFLLENGNLFTNTSEIKPEIGITWLSLINVYLGGLTTQLDDLSDIGFDNFTAQINLKLNLSIFKYGLQGF